jgi:hypothetical protein
VNLRLFPIYHPSFLPAKRTIGFEHFLEAGAISPCNRNEKQFASEK